MIGLFEPLGDGVEDVLSFRDDLGTLEGRRWTRFSWTLPADELEPCWWIANATEEDKGKPPRLLSRSLACLRLELNANRVATSAHRRPMCPIRSRMLALTGVNLWHDALLGPRGFAGC